LRFESSPLSHIKIFRREEEVMEVSVREIIVDVENNNRSSYADVKPNESPAQRSVRGTADSPVPPKPPEIMPDREYVRSMEERYGIREEGVF
jgi:hypothetical protein